MLRAFVLRIEGWEGVELKPVSPSLEISVLLDHGDGETVGLYCYDPVYGHVIPLPSFQEQGKLRSSAGLVGMYVVLAEKGVEGLEGRWYQKAVDILARKHLLPRDGTPDWERPLNRGQAARMLALASGVPGKQSRVKGFRDLKTGELVPYVETLADRGLVFGYPDGTFRPDCPLTRAEMARLILRFWGKTPNQGADVKGDLPFKDVPRDHWAYETIKAACALGFVSGYPDGTFKPEEAVSWAEGASMMTRAFKSLEIRR